MRVTGASNPMVTKSYNHVHTGLSTTSLQSDDHIHSIIQHTHTHTPIPIVRNGSGA
jgi:hypothetical protein